MNNIVENSYIIGDNLELLKNIENCSIALCYLDPPFNTGRNFDDYDDRWDSTEEYIEFLQPRIKEIHRVLTKNGNVVVHVDANVSHKIRNILDSIFGEQNFQNEIVWKTTGNKKCLKNLARSHDTIIVYSKNKKNTFNAIFHPYDEKYNKKNQVKFCDQHKKMYVTTAAHNSQPNVEPRLNLRYEWNGHSFQWYLSKEKMKEMHEQGRLHYNKKGIPRIKRFLEEMKGVPVKDVWDDIPSIQGNEKLDYATQKPIKLLNRILTLYSNENDLVLDPFAGSGSMGRSAISCNRKYILFDKNIKGKEVFEKSIKEKNE